ncbi:MAG: multicopper oxidase domain-containing protein, partial [Marmoricola sp.]
MQEISRRGLLLGGLTVAGTGALAACSNKLGTSSPTFARPPRLKPLAGQRVVEHNLTAKATSLDLGGTTVETWAFGDAAPGPLIRANAGDMLRIRVHNQLPTDTSVHWHGIALRNVADGVPGLTQDPIATGSSYLYEFTAPDPGTYFYHPHVGVQLDRGLYAPLIIEDPHEPGDYDLELVVVLDDWLDGTGRTPDDVLANLTGTAGDGSNSMGGMDMGGMSMGGNPPFGDAGDVTYPHYLINGRVPTAPDVLRGKPG